MSGYLNEGDPGHVQNLGDGMMAVRPRVDVRGDPTMVKSPVFSPAEWSALLEHPVCQPGRAEHRLTFTLDLVSR